MLSYRVRDLLDTLPQKGVLERMAVRPVKREPLLEMDTLELCPEAGIVGDHYRGRNRKRQVTLIQGEHLAAVGQLLGGHPIDPLLTRRNLVVSGINLLAFKNRRFSIGEEVILEMTGPCEPCSWMERNFGPGGYNAMRGHGGICARIIKGGILRRGDVVRLLIGADGE